MVEGQLKIPEEAYREVGAETTVEQATGQQIMSLSAPAGFASWLRQQPVIVQDKILGFFFRHPVPAGTSVKAFWNVVHLVSMSRAERRKHGIILPE